MIITGGGTSTAVAPFDTWQLCDAAKRTIVEPGVPGRTIIAYCVPATLAAEDAE